MASMIKEDNLKLQGTWSSPAGEKKVFVTENLKILWFKNKKFLTIEGEDANKIIKYLTGTMCTSNDVDNVNAIGNKATNAVDCSDETPAENHHSSACVCSELSPELDLVILESKFGHKIQAIEEKLLRMNEYHYGNSTEKALSMETIVINDSGNNAKELSEYGHFNKNASTLT
ncbi:Hypothetical predicted protein [Paramuricea clavata]|uniref:Uncharacterized protein n=1 Tax=Paramuricea clavata TaxID=317549 RepID=A0A6S7HBZ9_PARCT|nr:Hypothetical predicted protein [Paramuricea clavata]